MREKKDNPNSRRGARNNDKNRFPGGNDHGNNRSNARISPGRAERKAQTQSKPRAYGSDVGDERENVNMTQQENRLNRQPKQGQTGNLKAVEWLTEEQERTNQEIVGEYKRQLEEHKKVTTEGDLDVIHERKLSKGQRLRRNRRIRKLTLTQGVAQLNIDDSNTTENNATSQGAKVLIKNQNVSNLTSAQTQTISSKKSSSSKQEVVDLTNSDKDAKDHSKNNIIVNDSSNISFVRTGGKREENINTNQPRNINSKGNNNANSSSNNEKNDNNSSNNRGNTNYSFSNNRRDTNTGSSSKNEPESQSKKVHYDSPSSLEDGEIQDDSDDGSSSSEASSSSSEGERKTRSSNRSSTPVSDGPSDDSEYIAFESSSEEEYPSIFNFEETPAINTGPQPWFKPGNYEIDLPAHLRLHDEITKLVDYLSPSDEEKIMRKSVKDIVHAEAKKLWGNEVITNIFGSFSTDLYLPTSDIDLVIEIPSKRHIHQKDLLILIEPLLQRRFKPEKLDARLNAKVPIINFIDPFTKLEIDISINTDSGLKSRDIVDQFIKQCPSLKSLIMVLKHFLAIHNMNKVFDGYIGSYALTLMVISFFQQHPLISTGLINPLNDNLGVLLMEFLELYGKNHTYKLVGIALTEGGYYFKRSQAYDRRNNIHYYQNNIEILDPENEENNVTRASSNYHLVVAKFVACFSAIHSNMSKYNQFRDEFKNKHYQSSLLEPMFFIQDKAIEDRIHLNNAYKVKYGDEDQDKNQDKSQN